MNDEALDYGDPNENEMQEDIPVTGERGEMDQRKEEEMDAEMQDWANQYDGEMEDFEQSKEKKLQEIRQARSGAKFYPLPREEGISAGANRGVTSQSEMDDVELLGPEGEFTSEYVLKTLMERRLITALGLYSEDLPLPETPSPIGGGQDIRFSVLHLSGSPVSQCSTSRLFAYITHYGAQPLGLEWINDSSCNIVFSDASAARLAIEYLCRPISISHEALIPFPNDPSLDEAVERKRKLDDPNQEQANGSGNDEWSPILLQSLLTYRKAHRIPAKLYNAPERDAAADFRNTQNGNAENGKSELPEDVPEIYREMEAEDRKKQMMKPEQVNLQKLRGTLWVRWALESMDVKPSKAAKQSKWYREHGNDAGKEVVTKLLDVGGLNDRLELLPSNSGAGKRSAMADRWDDDADVRRGRGNRKAEMDGLDAEMDAWRGQEGEEGNGDNRAYGREREILGRPTQFQNQKRGRGDRRGRMTMDALDEELERDQRDRSASPTRTQSSYHHRSFESARAFGEGGGSTVKVKGRGRMKAPSAWDEADGDSIGSGSFANSYGGARGGDNRRRGNQQGRNVNQTLEQRMSQSLEERMRGGNGNDLLGRMQ